MLEELQTRAANAVEMAKAAGADEAWASGSRGRSVEFEFRDGALEKVQEATSRALSVRLYVDGRYSAHSTTDLRPEQLKAFITEAVAMTRALQPDPHRVITDPALFEGRSTADLQLIDPGVEQMTQDERRAWCEQMNSAARAHEKVISATSGVYTGHNLSASVSSNGFEGHHEETSIWIGTEVSVQDEGDKRPESGHWVGGCHLGALQEPGTVGGEALEQTLRRLGAEKGPTQRTIMIVDPRIASRLIGRLLGPADAQSVQQGRSFWEGKVGQSVASKHLTVTDEPLIPRGLGSRTFDGEGIALKPMPVIEAGVAKNLYVDTYYGRKAGLPPTHGGSTNRVVALGKKDLAALLKDAGDAILVTNWLGGNADSTTGDFSLGCAGHLVSKGKIGAPVSEMNVTGNLLELFGKLAAVGNDPWPYSSTLCPTLVFEDVQFSGV
ncbi:MAG: TldD/PmbA family protein [Alphaproteobacteria bacterium]|nr:TldD/PmbA family protein [Alphaproteobacteria bacterium]